MTESKPAALWRTFLATRREYTRNGDKLRRVSSVLCVGSFLLLFIILLGLETDTHVHRLIVNRGGTEVVEYRLNATLTLNGSVEVVESLVYETTSGFARGGNRVIPFVLQNISFYSTNPPGLEYLINTPEARTASGTTEVAWRGTHLPAPIRYNITLAYTLPSYAVILQGSDPSLIDVTPPPGYTVYTGMLPRAVLPLNAGFYDVVLRLPFTVYNLSSEDQRNLSAISENELQWVGEGLGRPGVETNYPSVLLALFADLSGPSGSLEERSDLVEAWSDSRYIDLFGGGGAGRGNVSDISVAMEESHEAILTTGALAILILLLICCFVLLLFVVGRYRGRLGLIGQSHELRLARERAVILIQSLFRGVLTRKKFSNAMFTIRERARMRNRDGNKLEAANE